MRTDEAPIEGLYRPLRWWREIIYIVAMYLVYSAIRNLFGSAAVPPSRALGNAEHVIAVERHLGLFHELAIQQWFLPYEEVMRFWNIYYGSFHFFVTAAALVVDVPVLPLALPAWRNTLAS